MTDLVDENLKKNGDDTSRIFNRLFDQYKRNVYLTAYKLLGNEDDAHDVVATVYLKLWKNRQKAEQAGNQLAWIKSITVNSCLDLLRKRNRRRQLDTYFQEIHILPDEESTETKLIRKAEMKAVTGALACLTPRERVALILFTMENLSSEEIANQLGTKPSTVRNQIMNARRKIKRYLKRTLK